jgi:hypothetical protein
LAKDWSGKSLQHNRDSRRKLLIFERSVQALQRRIFSISAIGIVDHIFSYIQKTKRKKTRTNKNES